MNAHLRRIGMWLGHHEMWVFGTTFAVAMALDLLGFGWVWPAVLAVAIVANVGAPLMHDFRICDKCGSNLTEVLDPGRAVERRRRPLRYFHAGRLRALLFVALIVLMLVTPWDFMSKVGMSVMGVLIAYSIFAQRVHGRLMPWCPYCDHGGWDDEDEVSPEPQPVGGERQ